MISVEERQVQRPNVNHEASTGDCILSRALHGLSGFRGGDIVVAEAVLGFRPR